MKKTLALLLTFIMLLIPATFSLADTENIPCESLILAAADQTATEWFSSSDTRCLFSVCVYTDLIINADDIYTDRITADVAYALSHDAVYVTKLGIALTVAFLGEKESLMVTFYPYSDELEFCFLEQDGGIELRKQAINKAFSDGGYTSYSVDYFDFIDNLEALKEVFS